MIRITTNISMLFLMALCMLSCNSSTKKEPENSYASSHSFQLSGPMIVIEKVLFTDSTLVEIKAPYPNARIFYRLDHRTALSDTLSYSQPFYLKEGGTVIAYASHPDFQISETISAAVFKITHSIAQADIAVNPAPNPSYPGRGAQSLIDQEKGSLTFRNATEWLGFDSPEVRIQLVLKNPLSLKKLTLSSLIDQQAWIFGPREVNLFSKGKLLKKVRISRAETQQKNQLQAIVIDLPQDSYSQFTIDIKTVSNIPTWHDGSGSQGWLFLDQILLD